MKKRAIVALATIFSAALFTFTSVNVNAESASSDNFIFIANKAQTSYSSSSTVANKSNIKLTVSKNYSAIRINKKASFGDYSFKNAIKASKVNDSIIKVIINWIFGVKKSNVSNSSYYVEGKKNTTIGFYYTFDNKNSVLSVVNENNNNSYNTLATYDGDLKNVYYNEYTFDKDSTIGLKSNDSFNLYGLTVVSEDETKSRDAANDKISNLINYVKENGYSNIKKVEELINDANNAISDVNHLSTISNLDEFNTLVEDYNKYLVEYNKALNVKALIYDLDEVTYTEEYKNELKNVSNALANVNNELVENLEDYNNKNDAFNALSESKINGFNNKVAEANLAKGTKESYVLINEANDLYNALIESDKLNDSVVNSLNTLEEVKNAYSEYEESVTQNDIFFSYNEDGSIKNVVFVGTVLDFVSLDDYKKVTIFVTDENSRTVSTYDIKKFCQSLSMSGNPLKTKVDGVRYIYTTLKNEDNKYYGLTLSMRYEIEYVDGHIVSSTKTIVEVK